MKNKDLVELDAKDIKILNILQDNSTMSVQAISLEIGLTNNPCWRRIKRLQESGVIERNTISINRKLIGLGTTAFVTLKIENHNVEWLNRFAKCIDGMSEVIECHRMTGDIDYLLKIAVRDLNHYDAVYQKLVAQVPGLIDVSATFSMEEIKSGAFIDTGTCL
jgi:Lrp/AsnC family transcriptional regulator